MKDVILHQWIFFFVSVQILASPVPIATDDQNDKNPIPTFSADTHAPNCVSSSLESPDDSFDSSQPVSIIRRQSSSSCSVHQSNPDSGKPPFRILPQHTARPSQQLFESLEKTIQAKCPYPEHPLLLYCSGPEVGEFETHFPNTDRTNLFYTMVLNCLNAREATYGSLKIDRPADLLTNDKGEYCCEDLNPTGPLYAGNLCYKLSVNFEPEKWTWERMLDEYGIEP